jgi:hypothetical protein
MYRYGVRETLLPPLLLGGAMVLCAIVTGQLADVSSKQLLVPYFLTSLSITLVSLLLTIFWWVLQLSRVRADAPLRIVKEKLRERAPYLLLPGVIFPLFLASFTGTKTAIPFLVGYTWDHFWAEADRLIFRDDVWRIAHHWLGNGATRPLEWFYVVVWGLGLIFVMALVPVNASARFTGKFYTAMMATWLLGGFVLAYLFSAAGPVFAHLVSTNSADQFVDLRAVLNATLKPHGPIWTTQLYLPNALHSHMAVRGGGISAMPSMHLGAASIYVLGARRTCWLIPSVLLWVTTFVASGYFGYHYWIDGIVAAGVAVVCWAAAERVLRLSDDTRISRPSAPEIGLQPLPGTR